MIEQLFEQIADRLAAEVSELRWVDLEYGQLEIPQETYPVQFPCALIDFPQVQFIDETEGNQQADIAVQIRLGLDLYEDFHTIDGTAAPDRATALSRLKIISDIQKALQHFEGDFFTPLFRMGLQVERRDDGLKVFAITYGTAAKDDSGAKVYGFNTGVGLQVQRGI